MTNAYLLIKTVHIITAAILFGTGLGIAFFMFRFTNRLQEKFYAVRTTTRLRRPASATAFTISISPTVANSS